MKLELTAQSEIDLKTGILELIENYLEAREKATTRVTGLITAQQVKDELGIKAKTLKRWEDNGLRRYRPPLEDTRKIFYRVSDVLKFLGVENGKN
ncbi:TPA: XRE family transcriptional regulator [Streptococcus suis]